MDTGKWLAVAGAVAYVLYLLWSNRAAIKSWLPSVGKTSTAEITAEQAIAAELTVVRYKATAKADPAYVGTVAAIKAMEAAA